MKCKGRDDRERNAQYTAIVHVGAFLGPVCTGFDQKR